MGELSHREVPLSMTYLPYLEDTVGPEGDTYAFTSYRKLHEIILPSYKICNNGSLRPQV